MHVWSLLSSCSYNDALPANNVTKFSFHPLNTPSELSVRVTKFPNIVMHNNCGEHIKTKSLKLLWTYSTKVTKDSGFNPHHLLEQEWPLSWGIIWCSQQRKNKTVRFHGTWECCNNVDYPELSKRNSKVYRELGVGMPD